MIGKENYDKLMNKFGNVASWALWAKPTFSAKSNTEDLSVFETDNLLEILNPKYVFVGLNASSTHGDSLFKNKPWYNFHSSYSRQNDYKLRYALMDTPYWGGYITDIIKEYPEVDSNKVSKFINGNNQILYKNLELFKEEISLLGGKPVLIALGSKVFDILNKYFGNEYNVLKIKHYSFTIGKEDYRKEVLSILGNNSSTERIKLSPAVQTVNNDCSTFMYDNTSTNKEFEKQVRVLESIKNEYPRISWKQRGLSQNKINDINVYYDDTRIMILSSNHNEPFGKYSTDYVSPEQKRSAILLEGRMQDPEPETLSFKFRHRPKWDMKWYKSYNSYDQLKEEIIGIIKIVAGE